MRADGLIFLTRGDMTALGPGELTRIVQELEAIGSATPHRRDVPGLIEEPTGPARGRFFAPDDGQLALLLRATDHLRNLLLSNGALLTLRDRLFFAAGAGAIDYRLVHATGEPTPFVSYSFACTAGDRLVALGAVELVVTGMRPAEGSVGTLVVEPR